jgi:hypothetical protein
MIFAVMNLHPLAELLRSYVYEFSFDRYSMEGSGCVFPDVIPPFNILVLYQNELGSAALLEIIGVDITNDGIVTSIEDLLTEKTIQYRARDMRVFKAIVGPNQLDPSGDVFTLGDFAERVLHDFDLEALLTSQPSQSTPNVPAATGKSVWSKLKGLL